MKNRILQWCALLCTLVCLASCQKSDTSRKGNTPQTIELSSESIELGKIETSAEVIVKASATSWNAFFTPEVKWASIKQEGDKIMITTDLNLTSQPRSTTIVVTSEGAMKKVSLRQSAADAALTLTNNVVNAPIRGGLITVEVKANTTKWSLTDLPKGNDWIEAKADKKAGLIYLEVKPNKTVEQREVVIGINVEGGDKKEMTVTQKGRLAYALPFEQNLRVFDVGAIIRHGVEKGYILGFYLPSEETWLGKSDHVLFFLTGLEKTPTIIYRRSAEYVLAYQTAEVPIADKTELQKGGGYRTFLEANGYKERHGSTDEKPKLENQDGSLWLDLKAVKDKFDSSKVIGYVAQFMPQIIQDKPYETFPKLPLEPTDLIKMLNNSNYHFSDVKSLEEGLGGTVLHHLTVKDMDPSHQYCKNDDETIHMVYKIKKDKTDKHIADYRFSSYNVTSIDKHGAKNVAPEFIQSMNMLRLCFVDYNLGVFMPDEKSYKVTREFNDLLVANGFRYSGIRRDGIDYIRESDNMLLRIQMFLGSEAQKWFEGHDKMMSLTLTRPESNLKAAIAADDQLFYEAAMRGEYAERHFVNDILNASQCFSPILKQMKN